MGGEYEDKQIFVFVISVTFFAGVHIHVMIRSLLAEYSKYHEMLQASHCIG